MKKIIAFVMFALFSNNANQEITDLINYIPAYKFNSVIEEKLRQDTGSWKYQLAAMDYAAKGDYRNAMINYEKLLPQSSPRPSTRDFIDSVRSNFNPVSASEFIIDQARDSKILIINEAHHVPLHRLFTKSLLKELFEAGYKSLGIEALYNGPAGGTEMSNGARYLDGRDTALNDRKYPVRESGSYTSNPQYGDLIRTALELGYYVFSYEKTGVGSGKPRELGQAENIKSVMDARPGEKFIIHCGLAHAYEGEYGSWEKAMAGWLHQLTGYDPLTVNQVEFTEKAYSIDDQPIFGAFKFEESSVLIDADNRAFMFRVDKVWTDIAVFHPKTTYINNRPEWLFKFGNKPVNIDISKIDISFPAMILAFKKGEDIEKSIPVDIIEVETKNENPYISVKSGEYTVIIANQKGDARKFELIVK